MTVKVKIGKTAVEFPDVMTEKEIRAALTAVFDAKEADAHEKLLATITALTTASLTVITEAVKTSHESIAMSLEALTETGKGSLGMIAKSKTDAQLTEALDRQTTAIQSIMGVMGAIAKNQQGLSTVVGNLATKVADLRPLLPAKANKSVKTIKISRDSDGMLKELKVH